MEGIGWDNNWLTRDTEVLALGLGLKQPLRAVWRFIHGTAALPNFGSLFVLESCIACSIRLSSAKSNFQSAERVNIKYLRSISGSVQRYMRFE